MNKKIDISKYSKAEVLMALYNNSKPLGMGLLHYDAKKMTIEEAKIIISDRLYFDYLKGRVMKVDLSSNKLNPWLYDRDNGEGAAARAIAEIR